MLVVSWPRRSERRHRRSRGSAGSGIVSTNRGGGGNRISGDTLGSEDSRTVSRTSIPEDTVKRHEQNALPDILMTLSQIPDVNRELAEVGAMFSVFDALRRKRGR